MRKRIRRIGSIKGELLRKSREAALAAVQIFSNPNISFKAESYIVLMHIAWTYLLHAYYRVSLRGQIVEVVSAATKIREIVRKWAPCEESAGNFTQLKYCTKVYEPDGRTRRKRLLAGTKFNYEKTPIINKVDKCITNMACYIMHTTSGKIPFVPDGWRL
jgi:hypothetical protein